MPFNKTIKKNRGQKRKVFTKKHYQSNDGMMTAIWGPSFWHVLHTISFNYPINPTYRDKKHYRDYVLNLKHVLPCKYCRINVKKNFKTMPLTMKHMKNRNTFSRYIYRLHELINKMLGKQSGLTYEAVRERYEHFRARCTQTREQQENIAEVRVEKGCTEPLSGKKAKCILHIVPQEKKSKTFKIDKCCLKRKKRNQTKKSRK